MSKHHVSVRKELDDMRRETKLMEEQYKELEAELLRKQEEVEKEERKVQEAEARSQDICDKIKRLDRQEARLDAIIDALTIGNDIKKSFSTTILDQQCRMSKTIREEYDRVKSFETVLNDLPRKVDVAVDTMELQNQVQDQLFEIVKQVKELIAAKVKQMQKDSAAADTPQPGTSGLSKGPGRPRGRQAAASTSQESGTPKRKRGESSSTSARTTPARSARKSRAHYQESDDDATE